MFQSPTPLTTPMQPSVAMWILHGLFLTGVFINLVKASELILRPHQLKWLQEKFDSVTLWLEYSRPLAWYVKRQIARKASWVLSGVLFLSVAIAISLDGQLEWSTRVLVVLGGLLALVICVSFAYKSVTHEELLAIAPKRSDAEFQTRIYRWVFSGQTAVNQLWRQFIVTAAGVCGFVALAAFVRGFNYITNLLNGGNRKEFNWHVVLYVTVVTLVIILSYRLFFKYIPSLVDIAMMTGTVFFFTLILLIFELILKVIRGVIWRITEYDKGPFAAILLLLTATLGVAEAYFKLLKK